MQLVQTRMRLLPPSVLALTGWRFTFQRRRVVLCACEMLLPNCGPLPQRSHLCAMTCSNPEWQKISGTEREWIPQAMPGKSVGAGRVEAPDLYRVNGSLPIPNHTMLGLMAQLTGFAGEREDEARRS
jgi:hypothetical protein